jgi:hypothetical protein
MPNHDPLVRLLHMRDYAKQALEMASGKSREELDSFMNKSEAGALKLCRPSVSSKLFFPSFNF